jgi:predicted DNA-binding WGR domain protein
MAIISSIRYADITNDYNDGANSLKNFMQYAEAVSKGDEAMARRVLENLNPLSRKALSPASQNDAVVEALAAALRSRGYAVGTNVGQSKFRCDLAVRTNSESLYQLGILVDTEAHYASRDLLDRYLMQPSILRAFGWRFALVLTKDWYHTPDDVLGRLERMLQGQVESEEFEHKEEEPDEPKVPAPASGREPVAPVVPPESQDKAPLPTPIAAPVALERKEGPVQGSAPTAARHFEFIGGSSQKFWEISVAGASFTVRFGRIGTAGQSQTKPFADEDKANKEAAKLIAEKLKKGYVEKS